MFHLSWGEVGVLLSHESQGVSFPDIFNKWLSLPLDLSEIDCFFSSLTRLRLRFCCLVFQAIDMILNYRNDAMYYSKGYHPENTIHWFPPYRDIVRKFKHFTIVLKTNIFQTQVQICNRLIFVNYVPMKSKIYFSKSSHQ